MILLVKAIPQALIITLESAHGPKLSRIIEFSIVHFSYCILVCACHKQQLATIHITFNDSLCNSHSDEQRNHALEQKHNRRLMWIAKQ